MTTLDRSPDPLPERLTGEALVQAHLQLFSALILAQVVPQLPEVLQSVDVAAEQVSQCAGPFVAEAVEAAKDFKDHYWYMNGTEGAALTAEERNTRSLNAIDAFLLGPIAACSFAPEPIEDRRFMLEAAGAFGKTPDQSRRYVEQAIHGSAESLCKPEVREHTEQVLGLTPKAVKSLKKAALHSVGLNRRWWSF